MVEAVMKTLISLSVLILMGCAHSDSNSQKAQVYDTGLVNSGAIAIAPNGNTVISGNKDSNHGVVMSSADGKIWTITQSFDSNGLDLLGLGKMVTVGNAMYLTVATGPYTIDGYYHTDVYKSIDSGVTWKKVYTNTQYTIMWNNTVIGSQVAVALWGVPQSGYQNGYVDFGWYDISSENLIVSSRIASTNDFGDHNFPSETYIYARPSDNALVAIVRWGESPQIPYSRLKLSIDNGLTWTDTGIVWAGMAGNIIGCKTDDGQYWFAGYQEESRSKVSSTIWQSNPNSGSVYNFIYPFGLSTDLVPSKGLSGNGGIACHGKTISALLGNTRGNGNLEFISFSE